MSASTPETGIHILIVSAHGGTRRQLEQGLQSLGYAAFSCPDGEAALGLLKQRRLDVVITSTELLGMSGLQLTRTIVRIYPHVPIILMAPNPQPGEVGQALASGAADLVSETMFADEMQSVIQRNLERKASAAKRIISDRADVLLKAIRALTAAIDAKSHHAARHSGRVTQLSLMIGARLDLPPDRVVTLELAAQLHDVGKIGTPEAVLTKPGVLTDEEWVDVLKHPALGGAFLAGVPELEEIATIIRHHHEHFDGMGYPDGLQGEAIPQLSRVIGVADAYDAMTSERPYRRAMTHAQAADELTRYSGTQFDSEIVQHLLAALDQGVQERKAA